MPKKKYMVDLTAEERATLEHMLRSGTTGARKLTRVRILLTAADGRSDDAIAAALDVGTATVARTRQRFVETHLGALDEAPRPGAQRTWTGQHEAHLSAVACTPAPAGQTHWTLRLLADKVVAFGFAPSIARETVRQVRKKTHASPGKHSHGACQTCVPSVVPPWRTCSTSTRNRMIPRARKSTSRKRASH